MERKMLRELLCRYYALQGITCCFGECLRAKLLSLICCRWFTVHHTESPTLNSLLLCWLWVARLDLIPFQLSVSLSNLPLKYPVSLFLLKRRFKNGLGSPMKRHLNIDSTFTFRPYFTEICNTGIHLHYLLCSSLYRFTSVTFYMTHHLRTPHFAYLCTLINSLFST